MMMMMMHRSLSVDIASPLNIKNATKIVLKKWGNRRALKECMRVDKNEWIARQNAT